MLCQAPAVEGDMGDEEDDDDEELDDDLSTSDSDSDKGRPSCTLLVNLF